MRSHLLLAMVLCATFGAGMSACPATHGDYPGVTCMFDSDCFAQERCNASTSSCEPADLGVPADFAPPFIFDLSRVDLLDQGSADATSPEDL
jgi:hypothetical protein